MTDDDIDDDIDDDDGIDDVRWPTPPLGRGHAPHPDKCRLRAGNGTAPVHAAPPVVAGWS